MKVGDSVWLFDTNRRVYEKDGVKHNSPIYSEYFFKATINGETSRSFIILGKKFNKKNPLGVYTEQQKEDKIWANSIRYDLIRKVERCEPSMLRKIEKIMGD